MEKQDFNDFINVLWGEMKKDRPNKLYKYSSLGEEKINTWLRGNVYMPTPKQLNDVHECKHMYYDDEIFGKCLGEYADMFPMISDIGFMIYSLTNQPCNRLLWSYYTNNSGLCFEYEIMDKCDVWKVIYYPDKQDMTPFLRDALSEKPLFSEDVYKKLFYSNYFTKHTDWSHESEYRLIQQGHIQIELNGSDSEKKKLHEVSLDELGLKVTKITLGVNFDYKQNKEKVRQLYEFYKCNIRILRRKDDSFDFVEEQPAGFCDLITR